MLGPVAAPLRSIGAGSWLVWNALHAMVLRLIGRDPLAEHALGLAFGEFLWSPLPRLMALAGLVGLIAGVSAAKLLSVYDAELMVVAALVEAMLRQILPLVIGIFAAGSVSVELATRLGAMSLAHEIDALEIMGHDPVGHALAPPSTAVLVATPVHMVAAALAAMLGAGLPLHLMANLPWRELLHQSFSPAAATALLVGLAKTVLFALIALAVGGAIGSKPVQAPGEIGRRAGSAFTIGLLGIFAAAALWTALA